MAAPLQTVEMTKFPKGVSSYGMPVIGGGALMTTGRVFFVDSTAAAKGDDASHGTEPTVPFATIDFAIGQCAADRGDTILVLPGHVETIIAAAAIHCDVAGIRIRGLIEGRSRPKITFGTSTGASIDFSAANVIFENFVFDLTGVNALVAPINFNAADTLFQNNEIITALGGNSANFVCICNASATRVRILNNYFHGLPTKSHTCVLLLSTNDGLEFGGNRVIAAFDSSNAIRDSGIATNINIHNNQIFNISSSLGSGGCMNFDAATTGIVAFNTLGLASGPADAITDTTGGTLAFIENYSYDITSGYTTNKIGVLVPPVGSTLAAVDRSLIDEIIGAQFSYNRTNYIAVTADFSNATWNTVAKHEILVVNGLVRIRIIIECQGDLTSGGAATLQLGDEQDTTALIGLTTATTLDQDELWNGSDATTTSNPKRRLLLSGNATTPGQFIDFVVNGNDIGYEILTAALTGGSLVFHCWWEPVGSAGSVSIGAGGVL